MRLMERAARSAFAGSDKQHKAETADDRIKALAGHVKVLCGAGQNRDIGKTS